MPGQRLAELQPSFAIGRNEQDPAPAAGLEAEAPAEGSAPEGATVSGPEDISMEDVLGSGARKQPAVTSEAEPDEAEVPQVETRTY